MKKFWMLSDLNPQPDSEAWMKFTLTYRGSPSETHAMRLQFHRQLKQLWGGEAKPATYVIPPWQFVPLVTIDMSARTKIEIAINSGGVGREGKNLKAIIQALLVPKARDGYADMAPGADENPMYVLSERYDLFDAVSAEEAPPPHDAAASDAEVNVTIWNGGT